MRKNLVVSLFILLMAAMVLSACGSAALPTTQPAMTDEPMPTEEPLAPGSVQITGAGATFPLPVYTEWTYAYQYVDPAVVISYNGVGSGAGKTAIIDNTVDFAGSDSLLKQEQYDANPDLQMYPMLAGAVVLVYNITWAQAIPDGTTLPKLILDRQTLVDIFNGTVSNWNDPAIAALNPGLAGYLPDAAITVVHRSDGSGTTEIFTKALSSFSSDWTAGGSSSVEWPVGVGGKGNQGVAAGVINTPNSIGYVELSYAVSNGMAYADMINKAGKQVTANAASVEAAMAEFGNSFDEHFNATIMDGAADGSWPITGYTYIILHTTTMTDCVKAEKLLEYIIWSQTDPAATQRAGDLGYSVLPENVRNEVIAKLQEVTCNGANVLP